MRVTLLVGRTVLIFQQERVFERNAIFNKDVPLRRAFEFMTSFLAGICAPSNMTANTGANEGQKACVIHPKTEPTLEQLIIELLTMRREISGPLDNR
jgi:hypothetical protein